MSAIYNWVYRLCKQCVTIQTKKYWTALTETESRITSARCFTRMWSRLFTVIYLFFFSFLFYLILRYCYRMITQITNVCIKSQTDYTQNWLHNQYKSSYFRLPCPFVIRVLKWYRILKERLLDQPCNWRLEDLKKFAQLSSIKNFCHNLKKAHGASNKSIPYNAVVSK